MDDFEMPGAGEMMNDDDMVSVDDSPAMKVGEEKVIGNQGLKNKKVLKEGDPDNGDEVEGLHFPFSSYIVIRWMDCDFSFV